MQYRDRTPPLYIRPATAADLGARQHVIRAAWEKAYAHIYTPAEIEALFSGEVNQRSSWSAGRVRHLGGIVAIMDDMVVGTAGLSLRQDGSGEVSSLYVDPAYQGQGVGSALWAEAVDLFRMRGCKAVVVYVLAKAAAVHFYEARGCTPCGEASYRVGRHAETALCYRLTP